MFMVFAALGLLGGALVAIPALEGEDEDFNNVGVDVNLNSETDTREADLDEDTSEGEVSDDTSSTSYESNSEVASEAGGEVETESEDAVSIPDQGDQKSNNDAPTEITGSNGADVISGVNVRIDVASGIVSLHGDSAEILDGNAGDDLLLLGEGDIAEGGEGADEFVVDGDISGDTLPRISDFNIDEDKVVISLPTPEDMLEKVFPERPEFEGDVDITFDSGKTQIWVSGMKVCELDGIQNLDSSNFQILYDYHASIPTDFDETYGYV